MPAALLVSAMLVACGRGQSAEDRQLAELKEEITRVQSDHDRFEQRLSAMEIRSADDHALQPIADAPARSTAVPMATPQNLRIVRLSPDGSELVEGSSETAGSIAGDDPEDSTPRPSIRVQGGGGGNARGSKGVRAFRGTGDRIEETLPPDGTEVFRPSGPVLSASASRPSALDPEAKRAYDAALALVNAHRYPQALEAFAGFLVKWPDHPNADNAMYWRGECYFAQGEFARAAEQFEGVIARFPLGNKVPDSLLKLGLCQAKLGNSEIAKTHFDRLLREFPRSEAARRIPTATSLAEDKKAEDKK